MAVKGSLLKTTSALVPMFGLVGTVSAQEASNDVAIEEITVTAQRRAESLQKVPIAISAFSEQTIDKARIQGLEDVASRTPGFVIGQQSPSDPELTIRGIGSTDREAGSDRSVVLFVDEVYIGRSGASTIDFFDLERIEVLRARRAHCMVEMLSVARST